MRQASLKFKSYARSISIINNNVEKLMLQVVFWSFAALAFWYVLLLGNMVFNIVERRSLEKDATVLSNEVHDLELVYLFMSNNIDLDFSHSLGFKETNIKFAIRKSLGSIKMLNNEI